MIQTDMLYIFQWWLVLLGMGIAFLPITIQLFDKFFDKGYIFSKTIGMLLTGYIVFVLGTFHIVPFRTQFIIALLILTCVGSFVILPNNWKFWYNIQNFWVIFIIEELIFLISLFIWSTIHAYAPDIHGLEKYMDYGFINSFLRSEYLPAKDMWLTPEVINYYYFGHLITAMLTKLSVIPPQITFNLMLSTIFALCFTQTFSIGANLFYHARRSFTDSLWHTIYGLHQELKYSSKTLDNVKLGLSGIVTAFLVTLAGNLHILYAFFKPYNIEKPVPFWLLQYSPLSFPNSYWYPNATRYIHNTIHEFPIYSWVVADLHGHVLDIMFVLLAIALSLSLCLYITIKFSEEKPALHTTFKINPLLLIFYGLLLACMYMTNAWDGAIYLLLAILVLFYLHGQLIPIYKKELSKQEEVNVIKENKKNVGISPNIRWKIAWGRDYLISLLLIIAAFFVFTTPYNINFKPFVSGIGVLCAPEFLTKIGQIGPFLFEPQHCQRSPWWQLITLYGFFYFFISLYLLWWVRATKRTTTDIFVILLIILGTFLIIIPEFFYIKDIYPAHYRANTMFKLVFQSFIMLSIATGYIISKSFGGIIDLPWGKKLTAVTYVLITTALVYLVMTYPVLAVKAYYNDFKLYKGLDGTAYLKTLYPSDYEAITWLNKNISGQPVILEAQGDSYTDTGRVSVNTGLPTVLGWTVHEWLWRGSYSIPAQRIDHVKKLYESTDLRLTKDLLTKYKVEYVFVGSQENMKYPNLKENKFTTLGSQVFVDGSTKIYKITPDKKD